MQLRVRGITTEEFQRMRAGGHDAHGQPALVRVVDGSPDPCRHCLDFIGQGEEKLVLSHRPFPTLQPYAESGPIFLHRESCRRYDRDEVPGWFRFLDPAVVRGYGEEDWILYETGRAVEGKDVADACRRILSQAGVRYVHVRSKFGCFQCRVDRA